MAGLRSPVIKMQDFRWNQNEFSIREFVETYRSSLPVIIKTSLGYCSSNDAFTFSAQEVIRVAQINLQRRIIAKDSTGRLLSIPTEYPIRFHVVGGSHPKPQTLNDLDERNQLKNRTKIKPEDGTKLQFFTGTDPSKNLDLGVLEVVDTYEDQYLVGNLIAGGEVCAEGMCIPLFVQLQLQVATGFTSGKESTYQAMLDQCDKFCSSFDLDSIKGNPEIMLFEEEHLLDSGDYMYIEPAQYMSLANVRGTSTSSVDEKSHSKSHGGFISKLKQFKKGMSHGKGNTTNENTSYTALVSTEQERIHDYYDVTSPSATLPRSPYSPLPSPPETLYEDVSYAAQAPPPLLPKPKPRPKPKPKQGGTTGVHIDSNIGAAGGNSKTEHEEEVYYNTYMYKTMKDVPESLDNVSVREVADCLRFIHLENYVATFVDNDVDGKLLMTLDEQSLSDLGLNKFAAHKVIKFRDGWRPQK